MKAIGVELEIIGHALLSAAVGISTYCITFIIGVTFLICKDKISFNNIKDFFKKDKRRKY